MNITAIIQARMGSSRLPGKSLKKISKDYVIEKMIKRLELSKYINKIIFAIPNTKKDDKLANVLYSYKNINTFRGSENNVLDRFYQAGLKFNADIVIRLTADCPLIDPEIIDNIIEFYLNNKYDYVSNVVKRSFPRGFDCEVFSFNVLKKTWENAVTIFEQEHVTPYIYKNPEKFKLYDIVSCKKLFRPDYRICIDTKEDLTVVKKIFKAFKNRIDMKAEEIVNFLDNHAEILKINKDIIQKHT